MTTDITGRLPLNVYVIILGIGLFVFMLSMIFCCYLFFLPTFTFCTFYIQIIWMMQTKQAKSLDTVFMNIYIVDSHCGYQNHNEHMEFCT